MVRICEKCGARMVVAPKGRLPRFCSSRCRVADHRARRTLPLSLTSRRTWTRRDKKRPICCDGSPASSTNRATWATHSEVMASKVGNGFGIMLGDGLGCWDLDHCLEGDSLTPAAAKILASIDSPIWVERSMSGTGLHIFVNAAEGPGRKRAGVEFYSRARFIAVTSDRFAN